MKLNNYFGVYIILSLFSISVIAQDSRLVPFRSVLSDLENRFAVSFTYLDEDVDSVFISPPPVNDDLQQCISHLEAKTGLRFQVLDERFITISRKQATTSEMCGLVLDWQTGEKINGATLQFGRKYTVSNEEGKFMLKGAGDHDTLLIRCLGYAYLYMPVVELSKEYCDTILIRQQVKRLKEIVVRNFISQGIDKDADGTYLIRTDELDVMPGLTEPDVLQTIQALPGILSIDETVSDINVRGGTNDQNLILWNGIRMYQSGHFFGLISAFNPYITQRVGLIKNGTSAYLGEAVSSTLDLQTDGQVKQKVTGSAGVNMIHTDANITVPIFRNSSLQLSARRSIADLLQTPTYNSYFDRVFRNTEVSSPAEGADSLLNSNENFRFYDISAVFNYNLSGKDKIELSFLRIYNTIEYQENAFIGVDTLSKNSGLEQQSLAAGLFYRRLWNENLRTSIQLYLSKYELGAINHDIFNNQRLIQENDVLDNGLKIDAGYDFSDNFELSLGYQLSETGVGNLVDINNPVYRRYIKRVLMTHAAYTEARYNSKSGNTRLKAGVRMNYFSKFGTWRLEPRLAFSQRFLEYFSVEVLGELKSQSITQVIDLQNEFLGVEKRRWILSNEDDIPIITSRQLSAGLHYQTGGMLISVEGYIKQVNGIISSSQGFQNQYQYVRSTGDYLVRGLDFLINKRMNRFNTWLSYSLSKNDYHFPEFSPPDFPNNMDIRHSLSVGLSYQSRKFQISPGINWRTGKPYTEVAGIEGNQIQYYPANTSRLDDYFRIDISAKYRINFSDKVNAEIGVSVWNIIDRQNILNIYYHQERTSDEVREVRQSALSLTPNVMLRINF